MSPGPWTDYLVVSFDEHDTIHLEATDALVAALPDGDERQAFLDRLVLHVESDYLAARAWPG